MRVEIQNESGIQISKKFVRDLIRKAFRLEGRQGILEVEIAFVKERAMKDLQAKYRGIEQATDVLSFEARKVPGFPREGTHALGQVVICPAVVRKQATVLGVPFRKELAHVTLHGFLHLLGYDHEKSDEAYAYMHAREEEIMSEL